MKECINCFDDITNQSSYRGKYCIECDNKIKWNKKKNKPLNKTPEIINDIPKNHKECKKCNTILKNE